MEEYMITEKIKQTMLFNGYSEMQSSLQSVSVFFKVNEPYKRAVCFIDLMNDKIIDEANLKNIKQGIYSKFEAVNINNLELLCVFLTDNTEKRANESEKSIKELAVNEHGIWIADLYRGNLLIYENQPPHFFGLENILTKLIADIEQDKNKSVLQRLKETDIKEFIKKNPIINPIIIIINVLVFIILDLLGSTEDGAFMAGHGAGYVPYIADGEYYRLFTQMFMHFGYEHLMNNMLVLFFIGNSVEKAAGKVKYIFIYILSGLGASIISFLYNYHMGNAVVSAGASGAVFGVIGALLYYVIINKGKLEDMTTKKLILMIGLSLYHGFVSSGVDNMAHIGGLLCGIILTILINVTCRFFDYIIK